MERRTLRTNVRAMWRQPQAWATLISTSRVIGVIATGYLSLAITYEHRWDQVARAWDSALPIGILLAFFLSTGSRHPLRNAALPVIGVAVVVPAVLIQPGNGHHVQDLLTVAQVLGGFAVVALIIGLILQAHPPAGEDTKQDVFIRPSYFLFVMIVLLPAHAIYYGARAGVQFALTEGAVVVGIIIGTLWEIRRLSSPVLSPGEAAVVDGLNSEKDGDLPGAKAAYERAIDSRERDALPWAAVKLGDMLTNRGDIPAAKNAYQRAIDSWHQDWAPEADISLGLLLEKSGDVDAAKAAYQHAIDSQHQYWAPRAGVSLGLLLDKSGDVDAAKAAYQHAIAFQNVDWIPMAAARLDELTGHGGG